MRSQRTAEAEQMRMRNIHSARNKPRQSFFVDWSNVLCLLWHRSKKPSRHQIRQNDTESIAWWMDARSATSNAFQSHCFMLYIISSILLFPFLFQLTSFPIFSLLCLSFPSVVSLYYLFGWSSVSDGVHGIALQHCITNNGWGTFPVFHWQKW